ncbi:sterol desaturase family protein [Neolewinella antarctica]|uniref:Sterol desaturase/sphingolipid hydroxylase (Fatty acid hydroxylase superfamily) n=1 Tax=Neolewinella antarctica TaxID=442734 RepID=A0ABX0X5Y2_9BACT|nr:sterol desaturase family protein [Neolewinella antarctica]NJC24547.1 sterol desaturase/sphingolipid hydroxylase (fatty acid hydroxylase superfamily) [Neolewinella antarctica]
MQHEPGHWLFWVIALFAIIFVRYLLFSGGYDWLFTRKLRDRLRGRVFPRKTSTTRLRRLEILRSAGVSFIFAAFGIGLLWAWAEGYTQLYTEFFSAADWVWLALGPVVFLLAQETYYYWVHRWMHKPGVYEHVHKWHHESIETTAWTAFSFHPIEAALQAVFIPIAAFLIPMHVFAFLTLLAVMTLSATINHAGVEIFPASWARIPFLRGLVGATHHDVHHKRAKYHYGLYFTFWDKWMGTEVPGFGEEFRRVTER